MVQREEDGVVLCRPWEGGAVPVTHPLKNTSPVSFT